MALARYDAGVSTSTAAVPVVAPAVLQLAEHLNTYAPPRAGDQCFTQDPRFVLFLAACSGAEVDPHFTVVQRLRLQPSELPAVVAQVRAQLRAQGRTSATWEVGPSAAPTAPEALSQLLQAHGMTPDQVEPLVMGMVLLQPPIVAIPPHLTVERVQTPEALLSLRQIFQKCFGMPPYDPADLPADWARFEQTPSVRSYLALSQGRPIAAADATVTKHALLLSGGATLPEARGLGAYKALIAARFADAQALGTPVLVTQAGAMSRPILSRLGFIDVAPIRVFLDRF